MSKHKIDDELHDILSSVLPYLILEEPRKKGKPTGTSFLPHLVPEVHLMKTENLPPPPVVGRLLLLI